MVFPSPPPRFYSENLANVIPNLNFTTRLTLGMSSARSPVTPMGGPVIRSGHLRKLKTSKKKFFVLRGEAPGCNACLEYYDSRKKFENKQPPKRNISLHSCFNINKRVDTKYRNVIALYTKDECFCLIVDSEKELEDWLNAMLLLQGGDVPDGEQPRPTFEHVWKVTMQKKGLGEKKNIQGPYRLCLTDHTLSLVKIGVTDNSDSIEFSLMCIRRCGYMDRIFYMEVGRSAVTGVGEFWMETEDSNVAHNMHAAILNAMSNTNSSKEEFGPRQRGRKEQKTGKEQVDPLRESNTPASAPSQSSQSQSTLSSNTLTAVAAARTGATTGHAGNTVANANVTVNRRRHSVASHSHPVFSQSNTITITTTATTTTTTTTLSHQRTLSLPLAAAVVNQSQPSKRSVLRCASGRERCDSLPSRARHSSESHPTVVLGHPRTAHLAPHIPRPHSMYGKGLSYSPPVSSMPISPASAACSTDSAGSSLSMDEGGESILEEGPASRYGHSLTPDEPVILEENGDDYAIWSAGHPHKYSPIFKSQSPSQQSSYTEMYSPCSSSPGRGGGYMPMSPAINAHLHSRTSSFVEESSTLPDGYVPMAPLGDDGYVDMDPANPHNGHFPDDMSQHGGSSCSVTSGTPSTDLRFSEYHLDKVTSYLPPGEDLQSRPTRAYSVGSRPEPASRQRKNRLEIAQQDSTRVRAFSVGSRSKRPEIGRLAHVVTAPLAVSTENTNSSKSNSAPLLSSSWGHNSGCSGTSERMEDLMELDFTRPTALPPLSSPSSSYTQSHIQTHLYSNATDISSYVDMSPGQPLMPTTAPYVDMSGLNKANRNNNNNTITANHNHSHTLVSVTTPKPVITTLKPVEEAEGPYVEMGAGSDGWPRPGSSPQQNPSPINEDHMEMNGPPGGTRTAPVDLPQPRHPRDGSYVEMSFKTRPSPGITPELDYINMNIGSNNRHHRRLRGGSRSEKSRTQPIAIQAGSKPVKTPSFLPLNGSPTSESLASTPASPPRATPTGSSGTIFPFSLNSPQSPIKPFSSQQEVDKPGLVDSESGDYALMRPTRKLSAPNSVQILDSSLSRKVSQINTLNSTSKDSGRLVTSTNNTFNDQTLIPVTKRLSEFTICRPRLVTAASPTISSSPSVFKPVQTKPASPKLFDDSPTPTPTPTPTSTPTPSPLDSDGYEKLQPGASILHYASLDLPEVDGAPPVSPVPPQEGFNYAEIDFAKLK